jgi:hypothetical protein
MEGEPRPPGRGSVGRLAAGAALLSALARLLVLLAGLVALLLSALARLLVLLTGLLVLLTGLLARLLVLLAGLVALLSTLVLLWVRGVHLHNSVGMFAHMTTVLGWDRSG